MVKEGNLLIKEFELKYSVFGEGNNVLLAFHGFNQTRSHFKFLSDHPRFNNFRIIAVGLFHHESNVSAERPPDKPISIQEFSDIIDSLCRHESIERFSLLGYSIGCRLCLQIFAQMSNRIDKIVLLAPDGISKNKWYFFLMNTFAGKGLFRLALRRLDFVKHLNKLLFRVRITNAYENKIASKALEKRETLELVWKTWSAYKKIYPKKETWIAAMIKSEIPCCFIFGKYDKMIPAKLSNELSKLNRKSSKIIVLESGHDLLNVKHIDSIAECFS